MNRAKKKQLMSITSINFTAEISDNNSSTFSLGKKSTSCKCLTLKRMLFFLRMLPSRQPLGPVLLQTLVTLQVFSNNITKKPTFDYLLKLGGVSFGATCCFDKGEIKKKNHLLLEKKQMVKNKQTN